MAADLPRPQPHTLLVEDYYDTAWRGRTLLHLSGGRIESAEPASAATHADHRMPGAVFPGIADAHVHLGLVDATELLPNGLSWVRDLGWDPHAAADWAADDPRLPEIAYAGAFLTCAGGYPSDRAWAPAGSIQAVAGAQDAQAAVDAQLRLGASVIKITLNADAGPALDLETARAVTAAAHAAGVRVVAHAEGTGQAEKALAAGVDELAHVPWTERLPDDLIAAMAAQMAWVSTFDIHGYGDYGAEFDTAQHNARRFVAAGGSLRYGTDLGNGPLPIGVNERELLALAAVGLDADQLARASFAPHAAHRAMFLAGRRSHAVVEFARWLASARPLAVSNKPSEAV